MKFVLISFFLFVLIMAINITNGLPVFGEIYKEKKIANNQLAFKYCDSLKKNLFKGIELFHVFLFIKKFLYVNMY